MSALAGKRPDIRPQRKTPSRAKTTKSIRHPRKTDADDADEPQKPSLQIVQQARLALRSDDDRRKKAAHGAVPLLYAPAGQGTIDDVQMFADFFERYYPPSLQVWRQITYLRDLMQFTPNTPVLKRARRTIGLTHLAAISLDARLIRESRVSYGRLLGMLQFTLAFPSQIQTAGETRELVASVALLTHVSNLPATSTTEDDSWATHMLATQQLFTKYAAISLPGVDRLDEGLMRHTIMNGFFVNIAKRKAWSVDVSWFQGLQSKGWTKLIPAFNELPGLLEETDEAISRQAETATLNSIISRLCNVKTTAATIFPMPEEPASLDAAGLECLDANAEEHLVMADSEIFPFLYVPLTDNGAVDAFRLVLTAFLALVLECTLLRIWHFRAETLLTHPLPSPQPAAESRAYHLARALCKVSLSFTQSDRRAYVSVLRFCLSLARNVFEQQDRHAEMGWCDACLIANQLRMQRIRQTSAPTLCKVEDITSGIAEAGRYKSPFDPRAFVIRAAQPPTMRLLH